MRFSNPSANCGRHNIIDVSDSSSDEEIDVDQMVDLVMNDDHPTKKINVRTIIVVFILYTKEKRVKRLT